MGNIPWPGQVAIVVGAILLSVWVLKDPILGFYEAMTATKLKAAVNNELTLTKNLLAKTNHRSTAYRKVDEHRIKVERELDNRTFFRNRPLIEAVAVLHRERLQLEQLLVAEQERQKRKRAAKTRVKTRKTASGKKVKRGTYVPTMEEIVDAPK